MIKEAYLKGYASALEKLGFRFSSSFGTAGNAVGKSTGVNFTRSGPRGISPKVSGRHLSSREMNRGTPKSNVSVLGGKA